MNRIAIARILVLLACAVGLVSALAGESERKKCTADTQECLDYLAKMYHGRGWMGVELDVDERTGAYVISHVARGGPAEGAGIKKGDVLHAANGIVLSQLEQGAGMKVWQQMTPDKVFTYTFKRNGREFEVEIKLVKMPDYIVARQIGLHMIEHANPAPER